MSITEPAVPLNRRAVIRGGRLLDSEAYDGSFAEILVEGEAILEVVAPGTPVGEDWMVIDARDRLICPGFVNAHTHGHGGLSKGVGDRWTLELLLNAGNWIGGHRTDEDRHLSTLLGAIEMLKKGCTTCFDLSLAVPLPTYEGILAVAEAYLHVGMRAVVAPMIGDIHFYRAIPGLMDAAPTELRRQMQDAASTAGASLIPALASIAHKWSLPSHRVRLGLAPTIPLHCTDEFLLGCHHLARENGLRLQTHLAETKLQANVAKTRYGQSTTAHLASLGIIDESFSGAHGVWLDPSDLALLAHSGAAIAHNPGSNLRLGSGIADVHRMIDAGVHVGVGTDGGASADAQNMFEATRLACNLSRVHGRLPDEWLTAREAIRLSTVGSARVLGFDDRIGRIAPGYMADFVFLDLHHINFVPLNDPANQLVHVENGSAVRRVMVGGRIIVEDGRILSIDFDSVIQQASRAVERLRAANRLTKEFAERLAPFVSRFCHGLACDCNLQSDRFACQPGNPL